MTDKLSYREAALRILRQRGPMHYKALTDVITEQGLVQSSGATPAASLNAMIAVDITRATPMGTGC